MKDGALRILVVEDNLGDARLIRELMAEFGGAAVELVHVVCLNEGLTCLEQTPFDVVLLDLGLPDSQGLYTLARIHGQAPAVPVVVLSGLDDEELAVEAVRAGAQDYLVKGEFGGNALVRALRYAIERKETAEGLRRALDEAEERRAESAALLASARSVLEHHSFKNSARAIFDRCKKLLGAHAGYVALLSTDGNENEVVFLDPGGHDCTVNPDLPMPVRGLRAQAYRTARVVYDNSFGNSDWQKLVPDGHAPLESVLFAPLRLEGDVVGLLGLANKPGGFTDRDARIAGAFGEFASVALKNSRMLESLETSERRFRSVVETAGDAVVTLDVKGNVVFWNQAAERIFGLSTDELVGKPMVSIIPERLREAHQAAMERFVGTGRGNLIGKTVELVGLRKDGSEFPLELSLTAWQAGNDRHFTGIIRDISDRKEAEELLRRAHLDLEKRVVERTRELTEANVRLGCEIDERTRAEEVVREQARVLDAFFRYSPTAIVFLDREFNFIRVNKAYARACGREVSDFPGHNHFEFYPSDALQIFEEVRDTKKPFQTFARPFVFPEHPERGVTYWDWTLAPILDEAGEVELLVFCLNDVTKRMRTEEAHRLDEARLEALVKLNDMAEAPFEQVANFALDEAVKVTGSELGFLGFMNEDESVQTIHAWSGEAMEQCEIAEKPTEFPVAEAGLWGEAIRQRQPIVINDYAALKKWKKGYPKGHVHISRFLAVPVFDGERIVAVAAVANKGGSYQKGDIRQLTLLMDGMWRIIQRRQAREALVQSEARLSYAQRIAHMGSWDWNILTNELHWSDEIYRIFGLSPQEFGATYDAFLASVHPDDRKYVQTQVDAVLRGNVEYSIDHRITLPGGAVRHVHEQGDVTRDEAGRPVRMVGTVVDITERKRAEEALERSRAFLQTIIDEIPEALMVIDRNYRVVLANRTVREMVDGKDPVACGLACYKVSHNSDALCKDDKHPCPVETVISTRRPTEMTHTHVRADGEEILVDVLAAPVLDESGEVVQIIEVCRDITARVRAEQRVREHQAELAHAARLGAMGEMASNLAHELSQPLATIVNYIQACLTRIRSGRSDANDLLADMERVAAQAKLAGEIIHGVRSFVRKGSAGLSSVNINDLARDAGDLVRFESRSADVQMRFELTDALPSVMVEAIQVEQVMVNLMRNAIEATKETRGAGSEVVVRTSQTPDSSLEFAVQDAGPGLSGEVVEHLFEPFFTTKTEGMGLGLSISRPIIESHGGRLWAENNPEGGSTFRFTLPIGAGDS